MKLTDHEYGLCKAFLFGWRDAYTCKYENCPYEDEARVAAYKAGYAEGEVDQLYEASA